MPTNENKGYCDKSEPFLFLPKLLYTKGNKYNNCKNKCIN